MRKLSLVLVTLSLLFPGVALAKGGNPPPPSPPASSCTPQSVIYLCNLTTGSTGKSATAFSSRSTATIPPPADALVLVHVMSCCFSTSPPVLSGNGLSYDLVVTHFAGEKRHWVFRAATGSAPSAGPITMAWNTAQNRALWIVDYAKNVAVGNNGADAIVQTVYQESQANASSGIIPLNAFEDPNNAAVVFPLSGSGAATNNVPDAGYVETAETETAASNIIISTAYRVGEDTDVYVEFRRDSDWSLQVQSWLFLAIELDAA